MTRPTVAFLGSGRCFHTADWFRSCEALLGTGVPFITDNFAKEGFVSILRPGDQVIELLIIDPLLASRPSRLGHAWRNLLKLALVPLQILTLRRALRRIPGVFVFAHSTYYAFLASFCRVRYASTPQGSEVLVRPKSRFYRWFLRRSVSRAQFVTVDSVAMADRLRELTGVSAHIVQNGIAVQEILAMADGRPREQVTSMRGIDSNYRILEILEARASSAPEVPLALCYPFVEEDYFAEVRRRVRPGDDLHGRLPRRRLYEELRKSIAALSIPISDSSPRSVYEAIFCGAAVVCAPAGYLESLPACMRARVVVVDLARPDWFAAALARAREIAANPYVPSVEALETYDQRASMARCLRLAGVT